MSLGPGERERGASGLTFDEAVALVRSAYRDELGREPDAGGLGTYVGHLLAGTLTVAALRDVLHTSPEGVARRTGTTSAPFSPAPESGPPTAPSGGGAPSPSSPSTADAIARGILVGLLGPVGASAAAAASSATASALDRITPPTLADIEARVRSVIDQVLAPVRGAIDTVRADVSSVSSTLADIAQSILNGLASVAASATHAVAGALHLVAQEISAAMAPVVQFGASVVAAVRDLPTVLGDAVRTGLSAAWDDLLQPIIAGAGDLLRPALDGLRSLVDRILAGLRALFEGARRDRPEDALGPGIAAFALATGAGFAAHGLAVAAEGAYPTKELGLHHLAGLVGKFSEWDPLVDAVWGAQVHAAVSRPLELVWEKAYRPRVPDEKLLKELLLKRRISRDEFVDWMGYHGLRDEWISRAADVAYRDLTVRDLVMVAQAAPLDEARVRSVLEKQGYGDEEISLLSPGVQIASVRQEMNAYRREAEKLYQLGALSEHELEDVYARTAIDPRWVPLLLDQQRLVLRQRLADEESRETLDLFAEGLIDEGEALARFATLGIRADFATARIAAVRSRRDVRAARSAAATRARRERAEDDDVQATVEQLYAEGAVGESELRTTLASVLADAHLVEARIARLRTRRTLREQREAKRLLDRDAAAAERARREALVRELRAQRASSTADERARRAQLVASQREFDTTDIAAAVKRGLMTADEADAILEAKGLTEAARTLKLSLWIGDVEAAAARSRSRSTGLAAGAN